MQKSTLRRASMSLENVHLCARALCELRAREL